MFKKLVARIPGVITEFEFNDLCRATDKAFDQEKINWNEHELIYKLLEMVNKWWEQPERK